MGDGILGATHMQTFTVYRFNNVWMVIFATDGGKLCYGGASPTIISNWCRWGRGSSVFVCALSVLFRNLPVHRKQSACVVIGSLTSATCAPPLPSKRKENSSTRLIAIFVFWHNWRHVVPLARWIADRRKTRRRWTGDNCIPHEGNIYRESIYCFNRLYHTILLRVPYAPHLHFWWFLLVAHHFYRRRRRRPWMMWDGQCYHPRCFSWSFY